MDDSKLQAALEATGNTAGTVADLVKDLHKPQVVTLEAYGENPEARVLVLPDGRGGLKAQPTTDFSDALLARPQHRRGTAKLDDLASFNAHVNRFKNEDSALFAHASHDALEASLTAVVDYHDRCNVAQWSEEDPPQATQPAPDARANWLQHKAHYAFPFSEEWRAWTAIGRDWLGIPDFACFLKDHLIDVMEPPQALMPDRNGGLAPEADNDKDRELLATLAKIDGRLCGSARLLELSRGLAVNEESKVEDFSNVATGEVRLKFTTEHTSQDGKPLAVPSCFLIAIPVFDAGAVYRLLVRLDYRLRGGKVWFRLTLHRADRAFKDAFGEACDEAANTTGLPLFYGAPES